MACSMLYPPKDPPHLLADSDWVMLVLLGIAPRTITGELVQRPSLIEGT